MVKAALRGMLPRRPVMEAGNEVSGGSGLLSRGQGLLTTTRCSVKLCVTSLVRFPRRRWRSSPGTALQAQTTMARFLPDATASDLPCSRRTGKNMGRRPALSVTGRWRSMPPQTGIVSYSGMAKAGEVGT